MRNRIFVFLRKNISFHFWYTKTHNYFLLILSNLLDNVSNQSIPLSITIFRAHFPIFVSHECILEAHFPLNCVKKVDAESFIFWLSLGLVRYSYTKRWILERDFFMLSKTCGMIKLFIAWKNIIIHDFCLTPKLF